MLDGVTPDPFVLGRILTLQSALQASAGEAHLAQTVCRGLLRIPGIVDCAFCLGGNVIASTAPERTHDLPALLCKGELNEDGCQGGCRSWRTERLARVAMSTQRRGYGGLLIRVADEDEYSLYEPYVDNTASLIALHIETGKQAAELREQSASLSNQVLTRTVELERSKARLELTVQGGDLGAWDWDVVSGEISYSERCASMLGYKLNEIEPTVRSWERLVHPDDLPAMTEAIRAHLDGKVPLYQGEHRRRHASGKWVWILDRGQVVERDVAGRPLRMCGTHVDVTQRKEADQALHLSEERLRCALEAGGMRTWERNLETGEKWSQGHANLFGPGQFDGTQDGFMRAVHPEDLPGLLAESARCAANRLPYKHEYRVVWPDGSVHWMSARGTFSYNSAGKPVRLLGVTWDITEQRQAEAERLRLTAAIEHAGESFVMLTSDGRIVYVNPAFEQTSGYSPQEAIGQRWELLKAGKMDDSLVQAIQESLLAGRTWSGRTSVRRKDGTPMAIECTVSPVAGSDGKLEYMLAVYRDITEQLRIEEGLLQTQRIESIGRLAAGIAHDFNNMLTPILGYTELLMAAMPPADPRYAHLVEVKKAAECSRDLARQLVSLSRKQALNVKPVDLRDVVGGMEQLVRRTLRNNIALKTVFSGRACPVAVDVGQVEQVLMNLAVNAQDAMPGGGKLAIDVAPVELDAAFCTAHPGVRPGRYAALLVSDTGCGMDEETRQRAFEPFFSTKRDHGTGLGLATVYSVVKQHAGSVWIDSEPGKGARFSIYFPEARPQQETEAGQSPVRQAYRGTETILLVEDNEMVRKLTRSLLQMHGYKVLAVTNGAEALRAARESAVAVDLLLADVVMRDMSARDLAAKLRAEAPGLKVLIMSGYSEGAVEHQGVLEAGAEFIQKPFSIGGLAAKLREALDRQE
jgi:two-component system, cell cycle sensor histidine kinase and response regulator CckA